MGKTKKVKSSGKFRTSYGMKARRRYAAINAAMNKGQNCPACNRPSVYRVASGIWSCRKCEAKFVGGAYLAKTTIARDSERVLKNTGN